MRSRGFSNLTTIIAATLAAFLVAPLLLGWLVLDVRTAAPDSVHVMIPFPLALARAALAVVPEANLRGEMPAELAAHRQQVMAVLQALDACPDATLLTVRSRDAHISITKQKGVVRVDVEADRATVHCTMPVTAARRVLERWDWQHVHARMMLDLLAACGRGQLLSVDAPDARVRIGIW